MHAWQSAAAAKMNPNDYNDPSIAELIYLVQQVKQHVLEHKPGTLPQPAPRSRSHVGLVLTPMTAAL